MYRRLIWLALVPLVLGVVTVWAAWAAPALTTPTRMPNDPLVGQQWGLASGYGIHATSAWTTTTGGDITVAILDSGFDLNHPDLMGRWLYPYNFLEPGDPNTGAWTDNYGTAITGVLAATGDNGLGVSGVTWQTRVLPLRVVGRSTASGEPVRFFNTVDIIERALDYAAQQGARIVVFGFSMRNLTPDEQTKLQNVIRRLQNPLTGGNLMIIAPVGERPDTTPYPAALEGVIGVTGIMTDGLALQIRSSGQLVVPSGSFVDLAAPGQAILTTTWNPGGTPLHTYSSVPLGTEYASAFVAGAAALVLSIDPSLAPAQVETILRASARDLGTPGTDPLYGAGLVNAMAAVQQTRHFLTLRPNTITLAPQIGASAILTNPYTLAASWRVDNHPQWITVDTPQDNASTSSVRVRLNRVPTCAEITSAAPIILSSTSALSYGPVEVPVQVSDVCQSSGATPTPPVLTPVVTLTPAPRTPTPPVNSRLFLPLLEQRCKSPGDCREPRKD